MVGCMDGWIVRCSADGEHPIPPILPYISLPASNSEVSAQSRGYRNTDRQKEASDTSTEHPRVHGPSLSQSMSLSLFKSKL